MQPDGPQHVGSLLHLDSTSIEATIAMMPLEMINIECAFEKMSDFQTTDEATTDVKVTVRCTAKISPNDLFGPCMNQNNN